MQKRCSTPVYRHRRNTLTLSEARASTSSQAVGNGQKGTGGLLHRATPGRATPAIWEETATGARRTPRAARHSRSTSQRSPPHRHIDDPSNLAQSTARQEQHSGHTSGARAKGAASQVAGSTRHSCSLRILTLQQVEKEQHRIAYTAGNITTRMARRKKGAHTAQPVTKPTETLPLGTPRQPCEGKFLSVYCIAHRLHNNYAVCNHAL